MSGWIVAHEAVLRGSALVDFDVTLGTRFHATYRERSSVDPRLVGMPDHQFDIRQSVRWMLMLPFRPTRRRPPIRIHTQQEAA